MLLFNSIDDIGFHFVKARFELAEAFVEDSCHTNKHVTDLLRHSRTERSFKLRFQSSDDRFCVPLALLIESHERVLEFQYFSYNDLHFIFILALNNVIIFEQRSDNFIELN